MFLALPFFLDEPHEFIYVGLIIILLGVVWILRRQRELERKKKDLILRISHELRTPLTVIKGIVSILSENKMGNLRNDQKELVKNLEKAVTKLDRVIKKLSDKSKFELNR